MSSDSILTVERFAQIQFNEFGEFVAYYGPISGGHGPIRDGEESKEFSSPEELLEAIRAEMVSAVGNNDVAPLLRRSLCGHVIVSFSVFWGTSVKLEDIDAHYEFTDSEMYELEFYPGVNEGLELPLIHSNGSKTGLMGNVQYRTNQMNPGGGRCICFKCESKKAIRISDDDKVKNLRRGWVFVPTVYGPDGKAANSE